MQVIYRLMSPSGMAYIGQTKSLSERLSTYRNYKCKQQKLLYRSLCKYGFENHELYIVHKFPDEVPQHIIDAYEIYVIAIHKIICKGVLNITNGGRGFRGMKPTKENRAAILAATQGEKHKLSKLTEAQVLEIRALYCKGKRGYGVRVLSKKYNVDDRLIYNIVNNKTWKHLIPAAP